jgi:hypothetical protein
VVATVLASSRPVTSLVTPVAPAGATFHRIHQPYMRSLSKHLSSFLKTWGLVVTLIAGPALAEQSSTPAGGSAVLPIPQPQFEGVIGRKASESTPDFPTPVTAPSGGSNVMGVRRPASAEAPALPRFRSSKLARNFLAAVHLAAVHLVGAIIRIS